MTVWNQGGEWYEQRRENHAELWRWFEEFILSHQIESLLEIGGGDGFAAQLVATYCGVDSNSAAIEDGRIRHPHAEFIEADWLDINPARFAVQFDAVAAFAVVEHCESYVLPIVNAIRVRPRFVIVSFFRGLNREEDDIRRIESTDTDWSTAGGVYFDNAYARGPLEYWLDGQRWAWMLTSVGTDTLLIIEP